MGDIPPPPEQEELPPPPDLPENASALDRLHAKEQAFKDKTEGMNWAEKLETTALPMVQGMVGTAGEWMTHPIDSLETALAPHLTGVHENIQTMSSVLTPIGKTFTWLVDKANRLGGTAVAGITLPLQSSQNWLTHYNGDLIASGRKRDAEEAAKVDGGEVSSFDKMFPARLVEDVAAPLFSRPLEDAGKALQGLDSRTAQSLGRLTEGMAGAAGILGSIWLSKHLDPMALTSFGKLTEAGIAAEKEGTLAKGFARQMQEGQRELVSLRAPFTNKTAGTTLGPVGPKAIEAASNVMASLEATKVGQYARGFMSNSGLQWLDDAIGMREMQRNGIEYNKRQLAEHFEVKANSLGLDLADPTVRKRVYDVFDNPTKYMESKNGVTNIDLPEQKLFSYMNSQLQREVELNRQLGIEIPEKVYSGSDPQAFTESDRYVPRGAKPSKRQEYMAAKVLKEADDADDIVAEVAGMSPSGQGARGTYKRVRNAANREQMNRLIKGRTGVDDFFHDDPVLAYVSKIEDLQRDRADAQLLKSVVDRYGTDAVGVSRARHEARMRIAESRARGLAPDPDDVLLTKLDVENMRGLSAEARDRVQALSPVVGQNLENIRLPGVAMDFLNNQFSRPRTDMVTSSLLSFQNALKSFWFFNPGFHLRNFAENYGRAYALDVNAADHAKSAMALFGERGPWSHRLPLFLERSRELGLASPLQEAFETPSEQLVSQVRTSMKGLKENPQQTLLGTLREMGAKGTYDKFKRDLRADLAKGQGVRNNSAFRFSAFAGEKGEMISKFAYFNKLLDQGYMPDAAILKMNRYFPNYSSIGPGAKSAQLAVPFFNYMMKNAETTLNLLSEPKALQRFGPNGAVQRAIENWAGWNPETTWKYKQILGVAPPDAILGPVMPHFDAIEDQPDYMKKLAFWWLGGGNEQDQGKPINELEGYQTHLRLPSNFHALQMMDPADLKRAAGPMLRMYDIITGRNPYTGEPLKGKDTGEENPEKLAALMNELGSTFVPTNLVNMARKKLNDRYPEFEKTLVNMGLSDEAAEFILGKNTDKAQENIKKAAAKVKLFWTGGASKTDMDILFRSQAILKRAKSYMDQIGRDYGKGEAGEKRLDLAIEQYIKAGTQIGDILDIQDDYDKHAEKYGAPTQSLEVPPDLMDDAGMPEEAPETDPTGGEDPHDPDRGAMVQQALSRMPASAEPSIFGRASGLTRKYLRQDEPSEFLDVAPGDMDMPLEELPPPPDMPSSDLSPSDVEAIGPEVDALQSGGFTPEMLEQAQTEAEGRGPSSAAFNTLNNETAPSGGGGMASLATLGAAGAALSRDKMTPVAIGSDASPELREYSRMSDVELDAQPDSLEKDTAMEVRGLRPFSTPSLQKRGYEVQVLGDQYQNGGWRLGKEFPGKPFETQATPLDAKPGKGDLVRRMLPSYNVVTVQDLKSYGGDKHFGYLTPYKLQDFGQFKKAAAQALRNAGLSDRYAYHLKSLDDGGYGNEIGSLLSDLTSYGGFNMPSFTKEFRALTGLNPMETLQQEYGLDELSGGRGHLNQTASWTRGFAPNPDTYVVFEAQRHKGNRNAREVDALQATIEWAKKAGYKNIGLADAESVAKIQGHEKVADFIKNRYDGEFVHQMEALTDGDGKSTVWRPDGKDNIPMGYRYWSLGGGRSPQSEKEDLENESIPPGGGAPLSLMAKMPDHQLIDMAAKGDRRALEELVSRNPPTTAQMERRAVERMQRTPQSESEPDLVDRHTGIEAKISEDGTLQVQVPEYLAQPRYSGEMAALQATYKLWQQEIKSLVGSRKLGPQELKALEDYITNQLNTKKMPIRAKERTTNTGAPIIAQEIG